ncbi:MAG: tRNA epoxyqueuosine(34) reductase QueG [Nitrospirota bacterium]
MPTSLADSIKREALALGFSGVGIASAAPLPDHQRAFRRYLAEGRHAGMAYLAQEPERREDPGRVLPGANSVIALAWAYDHGDHPPPPDAPSGKIARYAWGPDYHAVIEPRLERLKTFIHSRRPDAAIRCAVDHAPVLERAYAQAAGIGFIGKHTLLIAPDHGSWVLLAELITDLELPPDAPALGGCGSCTRCLDACPTTALTGPFQLDAGRCIAYLTIEHKGAVTDALRPLVGEWLFGCDICQEACPYNQASAIPAARDHAADADATQGNGLDPWLTLDEAEAPRSHGGHRDRFQGTAVRRVTPKQLARNAATVRANHAAGDRSLAGY